MQGHLSTILKMGLSILVSSICLQGQLEIKIENLESRQSKVHVAIYDQTDTFLSKSVKNSKIIECKTSFVSISISDLSPGKYAIAVFQDLNDNGYLDKNLFGVPKEPYGFSGISDQKKASPKFEEASIIFNGILTLNIQMFGPN